MQATTDSRAIMVVLATDEVFPMKVERSRRAAVTADDARHAVVAARNAACVESAPCIMLRAD
jgi:hypothetical protein